MKNIKACLSHNSDDWKTPTLLYNHMLMNNFVDCFPYCSVHDQYEKQYFNKKLFINPPYSHLNTDKFRYWIYQQILNGCLVALLIPSRTDTNFFHYLITNGLVVDIVFFHHRLKFNDSLSAPFPSMLLFLRDSFKYLNVCLIHSLSLDDFVLDERFFNIKHG